MQIGHIIAKLRNNEKISQRELANRINVSTSVVAMWETNKRLPSLDTFIAIIDYFAVSADFLLENDRKLKPEQYHDTMANLPSDFKKIVDTFSHLNEDNRDILIGKAKELLQEQRLEEKRQVIPKAN